MHKLLTGKNLSQYFNQWSNLECNYFTPSPHSQKDLRQIKPTLFLSIELYLGKLKLLQVASKLSVRKSSRNNYTFQGWKGGEIKQEVFLQRQGALFLVHWSQCCSESTSFFSWPQDLLGGLHLAMSETYLELHLFLVVLGIKSGALYTH